MYSYTAFGIGIHSQFRLPELLKARKPGDLVIYQSPIQIPSANIPPNQPLVVITRQNAVVTLDQIGTFQILKGSEIRVDPVSGADPYLVRRLLVGNILALALYQRQLLVLHASSVDIHGHVVTFLGSPGAGKSTIAAALYTQGFCLVSDDVSAVHLTNKAPQVLPAYPWLRVDRKIVDFLKVDGESLNNAELREDKLGLRLTKGFATAPLDIRCGYVLARGKQAGIHRLTPQEATVELIRHSYPTRFKQQADKTHFLQCAMLAREIPFFRYTRPFDLHFTPDLISNLKNHILSLL